MLPVLTILFIVSYGLMATLVVEQGRTIDTQRNLIRDLFTDSNQLTKMKGQAFQKQRAAQPQANAHPVMPAPQAAPHHDADKHPAGKVRRPAPQRPPQAASDVADERRILISI